MLVKKHLPDLFYHLEEHSAKSEMWASEWIFSLFTSILPEYDTQVTSNFFTYFFEYKWEFFYKLVLSILSHLKQKLLDA
jgi:hypothetical protein